MYGTIFTLKPKQGQREKLVELLKRDNETPDGMVGWFLMEPDEKEELMNSLEDAAASLQKKSDDIDISEIKKKYNT